MDAREGRTRKCLELEMGVDREEGVPPGLVAALC